MVADQVFRQGSIQDVIRWRRLHGGLFKRRPAATDWFRYEELVDREGPGTAVGLRRLLEPFVAERHDALLSRRITGKQARRLLTKANKRGLGLDNLMLRGLRNQDSKARK